MSWMYQLKVPNFGCKQKILIMNGSHVSKIKSFRVYVIALVLARMPMKCSVYSPNSMPCLLDLRYFIFFICVDLLIRLLYNNIFMLYEIYFIDSWCYPRISNSAY